MVRIGAGEVRVEIRQVGLVAFEFGDELAHLQAPIAEMHVADHLVADEAEHARERVADDERAQMAGMHGLGDVRAAEVDDDGLRVLAQRHAAARVVAQLVDVGGERLVGQRQVDEAGACDFDFLRSAGRV